MKFWARRAASLVSSLQFRAVMPLPSNLSSNLVCLCCFRSFLRLWTLHRPKSLYTLSMRKRGVVCRADFGSCFGLRSQPKFLSLSCGRALRIVSCYFDSCSFVARNWPSLITIVSFLVRRYPTERPIVSVGSSSHKRYDQLLPTSVPGALLTTCHMPRPMVPLSRRPPGLPTSNDKSSPIS